MIMHGFEVLPNAYKITEKRGNMCSPEGQLLPAFQQLITPQVAVVGYGGGAIEGGSSTDVI